MGIFANLLSKKMNRQVETYQQELVQTHYQEVENMYRQMRGWRHDWRNHLQALKIYAAKGDLAGHPAVSGRAGHRPYRRWTWSSRPATRWRTPSSTARFRWQSTGGSRCMADAHIPVKLRIPEIDLCCILGNLFDNAIEASAKPCRRRSG